MPLLALESGDARLDRAERYLVRMFEESGLARQVVMEPDLGPEGAPQPAFFVSVRMMNFVSTFEGPGARFWAAYVLGTVTVGLGFLLAIDTRANFTHNFEFEVRVHDVRAAPMLRATEDDGTIINRYDTSVAAPLLRRTYVAEMETWIGAGTGGPTGADLQRHLDEQGAVLAQLIFNECAVDVMRALRRGAAQPQSSSSQGSSSPLSTP